MVNQLLSKKDLEQFHPFENFQDASVNILSTLRSRLRFDLWMINRVDGEKIHVLAAEDHGYKVRAGDVMPFRWSDSLCTLMTRGLGPHVAPCLDQIPVYANAPINNYLTIRAYIGLPMVRNDGSLHGTLCAIHPRPLPETIQYEFDFISSQTRLLSTILVSD